MKEFKDLQVGEEITWYDSKIILVVAESGPSCYGCFFAPKGGGCDEPEEFGYCGKKRRSDGKDVIFVKKGK